MKRLITRTAMVAGMAATLFATLVLGQDSPTLRVKIPFEFKAAGKAFQAGTYVLKKGPAGGMITLTGSDGTFEFYLPFGEYVITLDENILNGRYYILKNNYKINLTGEVENMYITFNIYEKKRKVRVKKFNGSETEEEKR